MGFGAPAQKCAGERSPYSLLAVAAAAPLVAGVFAFRVVTGVDGQHWDSPTSARIVLDSLKWGKNPEATVQSLYSFALDFRSDLISHLFLMT